jgi:pimeloyl-ACP methyl ester carboxylesterase
MNTIVDMLAFPRLPSFMTDKAAKPQKPKPFKSWFKVNWKDQNGITYTTMAYTIAPAKAQSNTNSAIIYFPGNCQFLEDGETLDELQDIVKHTKMTLICFDYPGRGEAALYNRSQDGVTQSDNVNTPIMERIIRACSSMEDNQVFPTIDKALAASRAVLEFMLQPGSIHTRIYLWGRSIGSYISTTLCSEYSSRIHGMVFQNGIASATLIIPGTKLFTNDWLDNLGTISKFADEVERERAAAAALEQEEADDDDDDEAKKSIITPKKQWPKTLILHGTEDQLISIQDARKVYSLLTKITVPTMLEIKGAGHNDTAITSQVSYMLETWL